MFPVIEYIKTCLNGVRQRIEKVEKSISKALASVKAQFADIIQDIKNVRIESAETIKSSTANWGQNDSNALDYVKNRTHYMLPATPIGSLDFTATSSNTIEYTITSEDSEHAIFLYFQNLRGKGEVLKVIVGGKEGLLAVTFDRGYFRFSGVFSGSVRLSTGSVLSLVAQNDFITFNQGDSYAASFEDTTKPYYAKLDFNYIPDNVYHSENAPVKFGTGSNSTVQGHVTTASGTNAHAEGTGSEANGSGAHAEGIYTVASGYSSHAEGGNTKATGEYSHAEGSGSNASGLYAHAEGDHTVANRRGMHAEGKYNLYDSAKYLDVVSSDNKLNWRNMYAASEYTFDADTGYYTLVNAEPKNEAVIGLYHANKYQYENGIITILDKPISLISGTNYNIERHQSNLAANLQGKYAHVVGNGVSSARSNAYTLDWDGNGWFAGDVFVGGAGQDEGVKLLKAGEAIPIPQTASVGQVLAVKAVDETGKPTEWEVVEIPTALPNQNALTFTGAATGSYDGSKPLTVNVPSLTVDNSLTQSGQAADAAKVGEELRSLSEEIANIPGGGSGLTTAEKTAMLALFKAAAYTSDVSATITQLETIWNGSGDSGGETEVTLTSISATYSGGSVPAGTALSDLTGIVVTAQYSDGSTATVTGYTLSGKIAEGSNTITVTYQGKTATIIVTGTAVAQTYTVTNNLTNVTNSNAATSVAAGGSYNATLTVADGCNLTSLTITMGGVDITDAVYGEGYILITDVTGDIVITAVATVPEYVDMATGIRTDTVKLYSDSGSTALATKNYQTGAYSLNRTETDAVVKVRLTNNTDSAISSTTVYIGSADGQAIRNPNSSINVHYAISGSKGSVAAGASVEVEYTVRAGYWLYVCGYGSLDVSIIGVLDVHEPTDVLATTSKKTDSFSVYSDAGTTLIDKATYRTAYATTEAFDVDTPIRLTVVSGGENNGNILYGCTQSGTLTANVEAHYGDSAVVKNFATGAALVIDYTVKAGYYFAVLPCSGATIYIEKA